MSGEAPRARRRFFCRVCERRHTLESYNRAVQMCMPCVRALREEAEAQRRLDEVPPIDADRLDFPHRSFTPGSLRALGDPTQERGG